MAASKKRKVALVLALTCGVVAVGGPVVAASADKHKDRTAAVKKAVVGGKARSVILLIGDGMGDSEITIGRNYGPGAGGRLNLDTLPLTGAYTTYSVQKGTSLPDYVPDSAATGTAWATGNKTYDNAVSVDTDGTPVPTILELAKQAGYKTGNVTTAEIEDATPAVLTSHISARSCYGPVATSKTCPLEATENGGIGSIAEQTARSGFDVVAGGGAAAFQEVVKAGPYAGLTVEQQAKAQGFTVVKTVNEALALGVDPSKRVLGLFADGNLDTEYAPLIAAKGGTGAAQRCQPNRARTQTQPTVDQLASAAIKLLDKKAENSDKGFFLQIEGASIDKRDHAADLCGQIGETLAFDRAVGQALTYQKAHPDTLVIVSADHGHTSQIVDNPVTPGFSATVLTSEGGTMNVSYGTADVNGSQQHTGTQVRVAAGGPQAANVVGVTNQTDLFFTMKRALGIG